MTTRLGRIPVTCVGRPKYYRLTRVGARLLSDEELPQVAGGFVFRAAVTGACIFDPVTCMVIRGDCCCALARLDSVPSKFSASRSHQIPKPV
jgi:hypothetical protein